MHVNFDRSYRKNLTSHGLIYIGGEELAITIKDISLSGLLAHLNCDNASRDARDIFNMLSVSTLIDIYLPEMRLAGEAEVVRVDIFNENILLAMEFKSVAYDVDNQLYKRKAYRKSMVAPGKIKLNGEYHAFVTVNVSVDGLMINVTEPINVEPGEIAQFEFDALDLEGEIKVIWVEHIADAGTLLGLQYRHMEKNIAGIPQFYQK